MGAFELPSGGSSGMLAAMPLLTWKPVNLERDQGLCLLFRKDAFRMSFGHLEDFYEPDGEGPRRYLEWLRARQKEEVNSVVHVFEGEEIIGQIETSRVREEPACGYVNLYYLVPGRRGLGLGRELDRRTAEYFRSRGFKKARLSVSLSNHAAAAFYEKMGWRDLGPRPGYPRLCLREKSL